jgi:hypothetical protein
MENVGKGLHISTPTEPVHPMAQKLNKTETDYDWYQTGTLKQSNGSAHGRHPITRIS